MLNFSKSALTQIMQNALEADEKILAAWVGGSSATGYEDDYSDIDLVVICEDPVLVFNRLEEALLKQHVINHVWKVDDSLWKNFFQKFYVLEDTPQTFFLDIGVFTSLDVNDYQEHFNKDRHGVPLVLFDKISLLMKASQNPKLENPPLRESSQQKARFEIIYRTFLKESLRGKYIDSFIFYQRLVMLVVQAWRVRETPQKHDFGLRYLYRDFDASRSQQVEKFLRVSSLSEMQKHAEELRKIYFAL